MAVDRVERLLRSFTKALDDAGLDYAVVGGNAVAAWVATVDESAVRATKDVDVLVRRSDLARLADAARSTNLMPVEVLGVHMMVDRDNPNPKTGIHFIIAGEPIRPEYKYPAPDVNQSHVSASGFRLINLPELVAMKLQSYRNIDRAHLEDMLAVNLIDDRVRESLPGDLLIRLRKLGPSQNH